MTAFDEIVTSLAILGLGISAVIAYLKVNKIWARKHIKEVAESVSVVAALLSLFTTLPFLVKFVIIDRDYVAAAKFLISLIVFFIFLMVGIGLWVRAGQRNSLWRMLREALRIERHELTYLLHSLAKPREAKAILRLLQGVSAVDREIHEAEFQLLRSVAEPWGLDPAKILAERGSEPPHEIEEVRAAFVAYLDLRPPEGQIGKVLDLVGFMVNADRTIAAEEKAVLEELADLARRHLGDGDSRALYEVLLVPQNDQQRDTIGATFADPGPLPRAGGLAYVAGAYFSETFAREICRHYRDMNIFATVEKTTAATGE